MTAIFSLLPMPCLNDILAKMRLKVNKPKKVAPKGDELQLEREYIYELMARNPGAVPNEISLHVLMHHTQR